MPDSHMQGEVNGPQKDRGYEAGRERAPFGRAWRLVGRSAITTITSPFTNGRDLGSVVGLRVETPRHSAMAWNLPESDNGTPASSTASSGERRR